MSGYCNINNILTWRVAGATVYGHPRCPDIAILIVLGTGKAQPADVGLNRSIKHRPKQIQLRYLVESYQKQIAEGLDPKQVKFMSSLHALRDASVAVIVEVYDFMAGPEGRDG